MIHPKMEAVVKNWLRIQIKSGATDEQILKTYQKENTKKHLIKEVQRILDQQRKAA